MSTATTTLLPWYLGYQGGSSHNAIQCMTAGDNGYISNHAALNNGLNNYWAKKNTPWSWGYLKRQDIPVHFAIAEGWTSGDMYQVRRLISLCLCTLHANAFIQESQITATNPNRATLVSGSVNVPGSPGFPNGGGPYLDNNETPGGFLFSHILRSH